MTKEWQKRWDYYIYMKNMPQTCREPAGYRQVPHPVETNGRKKKNVYNLNRVTYTYTC